MTNFSCMSWLLWLTLFYTTWGSMGQRDLFHHFLVTGGFLWSQFWRPSTMNVLGQTLSNPERIWCFRKVVVSIRQWLGAKFDYAIRWLKSEVQIFGRLRCCIQLIPLDLLNDRTFFSPACDDGMLMQVVLNVINVSRYLYFSCAMT